ncbi:winged helix-turn-helix domain-containing protein [Erwinia sorbitola]|uniref:Winged helix-turn-helix domain-containing protein n=1 Tax=Erwinia sorbitola TaxID=2681984 RepID=A0A6I6EJJ1_9GAMM|nr:winged helix-turn-helix domain-containing protein [Erwinia sorbitola]MTD26608.1 hypothetical protein [Erwinia sorbitola]QGU88185.1 hypothetical protein GN242_13565 [Erwinia sorbitola]
MTAVTLSLVQARQLHLAAQGLLRPPSHTARFDDLLATIRRMSLLQIDTIHVVARSPYLVLFSRLGDYPVSWLEQALAQKKVFEYWAHEACFIPTEDYPLLRHRMLNPSASGWKYNQAWMDQHQLDIANLLQHIRENGAVRSADFAAPEGQKPGWWAWKPHKRHLENLFTAGELMVSERRNFQRVYDLRQRIMPDWDDAQHALNETDAVQRMLDNSARSLGIFRSGWLADYYRLKRAPVTQAIAGWLEQGLIREVQVESLGTLYLHHTLFAQLAAPQAATHTAILSPFDPLVWDRKRALELFDFDYRLECYTPEAKRRYGYFVLPILHRGALKGRLDARMLRKAKVLEIRQLWLEPKTRVSQQFLDDVQRALTRFARWQGAETVEVNRLPPAMEGTWPLRWEI